MTGCGEEIDFYDSTPPSMFAEESSKITSSEKKKNSLFDEDVYGDTKEIITENIQENIQETESPVLPETDNLNQSTSGFWRDTLSEEDKAVYDKMYETLVSGGLTASFEKEYTTKELGYIYDCLEEDHPEIFWLTLTYSTRWRDNFSSISFNYINDVNSQNLPEYRREFEEEAQKILSLVPQDVSMYEKILFIHDYIVENTDYATDYRSIPYEQSQMYYNAYGCLVQHYCVCEGYSKAFMYLMHKLGIECGLTSGNNETHAWNYVKYDGEYYWIDVTWDDPVSYSENTTDTDEISHNYFFITTDELLLNHSIGDKYNLFVPECTATEYNYMRYFGNYMESYSFEEFDRIFSEKNGNAAIKFADAQAYEDAVTDLINNNHIYSTKYYTENANSSYLYTRNDEIYILQINTK